jgi:hypothetical protein
MLKTKLQNFYKVISNEFWRIFQKRTKVEYIARKINPDYWEIKEDFDSNQVPADVLSDLRTKENSLSVWQCEPNREAAFLTAIAIVAPDSKDGSGLSTGATILLLKKSDLAKGGLEFKNEPGKSAFLEANSRHNDIVKLDITKLCHFAKIAWEIYLNGEEEKEYFIFSLEDLKQPILDYIKDGKIDKRKLSTRFKNSLNIKD